MTGDSRFFFVHLQKTGGTSLFVRLSRVFTDEEIYPNESDGDPLTDLPQVEVETLLERWAIRGDRIRVVAGHFPLGVAELLDTPFTTISVLREPIERTLSYLRHHRSLTPEDRDKPLEAIYDDPFRFNGFIHNHMVKMFALGPEELTRGMLTEVAFTPDHLERARQRLETVDVVGLQERFADFWQELKDRFGWPLGPEARSNRTDHVDVPASFRRRIAEDNALDLELYEHARALVERRERERADNS